MSLSPASSAPPGFALRIILFFLLYFLFSGVMLPFFPVWLNGRGLSPVEIATAVALPTLVRVLVAPLAGVFADRSPNRRFAVIVITVPAAAVFVFAWPVTGFWPLLVLTTLSLTLWGLGAPMVEALALTGVRRFGLDYGRMRLSGSVAFITANLGSGFLLGMLTGSEPIYWLLLGGLVLSALAGFLLPVTPPDERALDDATRPDATPSWAVLGNAGFVGLMVAGGLIQSGHAMLYSFASIEWHKLGYSTLQIAVFWSMGIVCEVSLFFWSRQALRRFGPLELMVIGGVAAVVRWTLFALNPGFVGFALLQGFHGLTFAATYLGTQHAIARMVPERVTASAQSIYLMVSGSMLAATTLAAGPLYASLGLAAFPTMILPPIAGLALIALVRRKGWA